jgi:hypothetical protein
MAVWRAPSVPCVEGVLESLALRQADDGKRTAAAKGAATEGWSRGSPLRMARAYPSSPPIPLRGGEVWYSTVLFHRPLEVEVACGREIDRWWWRFCSGR